MKPVPGSRGQDTSIAGWSFAIARTLDEYGVDSEAVFAGAGINLSSILSPDERLQINCVQNVWRWAAENTDECFGIKVARQLKPASFHALGYALWSSSTMLEAIERLIRYRCVVSQRFFCDLIEEGDTYRISLIDQRTVKTELTHDAFMGLITEMGRELDCDEFGPLWIHTTYPGSHPTERLSAYFGVPIETESGESSIGFARNTFEKPLMLGNPDLSMQLDGIVERYIARLGLISEHMLRVRNEILGLLSEGEVSIEAVAENLNVTVRTLQRRLAAEQSTYNQLLDEVRHQLAMEYIQDPGNSVTDLAFRLGFNDSGSFGRSFKRWTGKSITQYRESLGQKNPPA